MSPDRTDRSLGVELFNRCWQFLRLPQRTADQDAEMLACAHASLHHWSQPAAGATPLNLAIGHWQVARVYSALKWPQPAEVFARRTLALAEAHGFTGFNLAFAHEGMARALALTFDPGARVHARLARELLPSIADPEDRKVIAEDLDSIPWVAAP